MDKKINVNYEQTEQQIQDAKKREAPLSVRADQETIAKFEKIAEERFPNEKDAKKKAMRMIVNAYDLSRLPAEIPSVAMQTESFNTAVTTISETFLQVVQDMAQYEDNLKKTAEEDIAEANAQRDQMAEELKKAQEVERTAIEERDKALSDRNEAQELAQVKTELADTLQAQVRDLQGQVEQQASLQEEIKSLREFISSRSCATE